LDFVELRAESDGAKRRNKENAEEPEDAEVSQRKSKRRFPAGRTNK